MPSDIAIEAENLSKCYHIYDKPHDRLLQMFTRSRKRLFREFWAVNDVSFSIKRGGAFGIVGRNGSGKSTLLQMICGTLSPTRGVIRANGRVAALLELGSGFNPEFTGRENIYMNASVLGLSKEAINERFDAIAAFADIDDFIEQPVKTYSSGMYMRLAFAVAAHVDAEILIIDEALAVGDALFVQKCMRFLRAFKERGTLVFVSHDAGAVTGLCEHAIWLHNGKLMASGRAKDISEQYLAFLYHGDANKAIPSVKDEYQNVAGSSEEIPAWVDHHEDRDVTTDSVKSALHSDIRIFQFKPGLSREFGMMNARINNVALLDSTGAVLHQVVGGERVVLRIEAEALSDISSPIVGFSFKDHLGQVLFGENTYATYRTTPIHVSSGKKLVAEFNFSMPILPPGDYSIAAAIATGSQDDHIQQHWIHDALIVKSLSSSVSTGLVGIPMRRIGLAIE